MKLAQNFSLYRIFTSGMVLQRQRPIRFSGLAEAESTLNLEFAGNSRSVIADGDGKWQAEFPALEAGGPYTLKVTGAPETPAVILDDILIGEVWLCSGQSNMEMPITSCNPYFRTLNFEEEQRNANYPQIRLYNSMPTRRLAPEGPLEDECGSGWTPCTPESARDFSACGYFFGRKLHQDLSIPIGLIAVAWGGTDICAWISKRKFQECSWQNSNTDPQIQQSEWESINLNPARPLPKWLEEFEKTVGTPDPQWLEADFCDDNWQFNNVPSFVLPKVGRYLCRFTFQLPAEIAGKELEVNLGAINDADCTYCNGVKIGATNAETINFWAALRNYTIPAGVTRCGKNCLAIVADDHFGSGLVNLSSLKVTCEGNVLPLTLESRMAEVGIVPNDFPTRPEICGIHDCNLPSSPNHPSTLFNGMLYPWFKYAIRGVIWYQGCTNNGQYSYYQLHQMLIDDWREHWNDPEMPFLLVQLAAYHIGRPEQPMTQEEVDAIPIEEYPPFAITREIQAEMPKVRSNVGMIVSFDRGDHSDIHPRDKQTLGWRLALKAEKMTYGKDKVVCDGPEFAGMRYEGNAIRVFFRNCEGGLTTSDGLPPKGFLLGNRIGHLFPAKAEIQGDTVVVSCDTVPEPHRVRYAFAGYCDVNLTNREGLPAVPFRSDKVDYQSLIHQD